MLSVLVLRKPIAILVMVLALLFSFGTSTYAAHQSNAVHEMQIDRDTARAKTALFTIAAIVLFAVALTAAPITGGASVIAAGALGAALSAGGLGITHQMEVNKLNRRIDAWASY